jgi:hypothetical protein
VWTINAVSGLELFDVRFYSGFASQEITSIETDVNTDGKNVVRFTVPSTADFLVPADDDKQKLGVLVEGSQGKGVYIVEDVTSAYVEVEASATTMFGEYTGIPHLTGLFTREELLADDNVGILKQETAQTRFEGMSIKPVYPQHPIYGTGNPAMMALRIMLSEYGDGVAHAPYDLLPGEAATETAVGKRVGAGLDPSTVDITSWLAASERYPHTQGFVIGIEGEESLITFLTEDIAPLLCGYVYVNSDGKIAFKSYDLSITSVEVDATITDSNILAGANTVWDETAAVGSVVVHGHYNPYNQKYLTIHNFVLPETYDLYQKRANTLDVKSRLWAPDRSSVVSLFDRYVSRFGGGSQSMSIKMPIEGLLLRPGDEVRITSEYVPNFTGTMGITAQLCEVTSVSPDINSMTVDVNLVVRSTAPLIAPYGVLDTNTTGDTWSVVNPCDSNNHIYPEFAVGWRVQFVDPATGGFRTGTNAYATIDDIDGTLFTFTDPPTDIASDDIFYLVDAASLTGTETTNTLGMSPTDYLYPSSDTLSSDDDEWG